MQYSRFKNIFISVVYIHFFYLFYIMLNVFVENGFVNISCIKNERNFIFLTLLNKSYSQK